MLNHKEVLAVASVAEPVRAMEPNLEGAEGGIVHGRALLQCRTLLFGEEPQALQEATETGRSVGNTMQGKKE